MDEDKYYKKLHKIGCKSNFDCAFDYAENAWGSVGECMDDLDAQNRDTRDALLASCAFDGNAARDCLKAYKQLSCEPDASDVTEWQTTCEQVWNCPDAFTPPM